MRRFLLPSAGLPGTANSRAAADGSAHKRPPTYDTDGNGEVDVLDLVNVILEWS